MRQNSPMASERAKPRMAYENSCCLREGFLAYPMMREPKTDPIPAPEPATPTVAAPAPMNLAAESMSLFTVVVVSALLVCCDKATTGLCQPAKTLLLQLEMAIRAI